MDSFRFFAVLAAVYAGLTASAAAQQRVVPQDRAAIQMSFAPLVKTTAPAVVNIYTKRTIRAVTSPLLNDPFFRRFFGDQLYFWIGRRWGDSLLRRFPRWAPGVHAALDMLRRYNTWFILSFRFIYGVRNFSSFAMGTSGLSWPRFMALNFIAAGIWAVTFAGAGYIDGATFEHLLGDLALGFGLVMLAIFRKPTAEQMVTAAA